MYAPEKILFRLIRCTPENLYATVKNVYTRQCCLIKRGRQSFSSWKFKIIAVVIFMAILCNLIQYFYIRAHAPDKKTGVVHATSLLKNTENRSERGGARQRHACGLGKRERERKKDVTEESSQRRRKGSQGGKYPCPVKRAPTFVRDVCI